MKSLGAWLSLPLIFLVSLPLAGICLNGPWTDSNFELMPQQIDEFGVAAGLSLSTSAAALVVIVLFGTPLGWWLSRRNSLARTVVNMAVETPVILPPAAVGVGLLLALGHQSLIGGIATAGGIGLAFSTAAVVIAQVVVAAPFYVLSASNAFREVQDEHIFVAQTLGATRLEAAWRVAVPMALPGLTTGASLAWARALGEFGATLIFAGNLKGVTQTLPISIFAALETDVGLAQVYALFFAILAVLLLLAMKATGYWWRRA